MSSSEMVITFPGGKRVDASFGGYVIPTDQPLNVGGADRAPSPFTLFLASIGTCAGIYVLGFCQSRHLPTDGIQLKQRMRFDPESGTLAHVAIDIEVPPSFPAKYYDALVRVAEKCAVKRAIAAQPEFVVRTVVHPAQLFDASHPRT